MTPSPTIIYDKLTVLEKELQRLKVEAYFALPKKSRKATYSNRDIQKAARETRNDLWRQRYAKKIARVS